MHDDGLRCMRLARTPAEARRQGRRYVRSSNDSRPTVQPAQRGRYTSMLGASARSELADLTTASARQARRCGPVRIASGSCPARMHGCTDARMQGRTNARMHAGCLLCVQRGRAADACGQPKRTQLEKGHFTTTMPFCCSHPSISASAATLDVARTASRTACNSTGCGQPCGPQRGVRPFFRVLKQKDTDERREPVSPSEP